VKECPIAKEYLQSGRENREDKNEGDSCIVAQV